MHITVQLEKAALSDLLADLLPITILLDEHPQGRWIRIDGARHLELGPDGAIRLATSGRVRWALGPVPITLTVQHLVVLLRPVVVGAETSSRVLFRPVIETADVPRVPAVLDRSLVALVNRALDARADRLAWDLGRTLALRFVLPDTLVPLEAAQVDVAAAEIRVAGDTIALTVSLTMRITRLADVRAAASPAA
jgi:hypothetical protein